MKFLNTVAATSVLAASAVLASPVPDNAVPSDFALPTNFPSISARPSDFAKPSEFANPTNFPKPSEVGKPSNFPVPSPFTRPSSFPIPSFAVPSRVPNPVSGDKPGEYFGLKPGDTYQVPNFYGKLTNRDVFVTSNRNEVSLETQRVTNGSFDSYRFYFTTLGFPRFWSAYKNVTVDPSSASFSSWSYDFALRNLFEFVDTNDAGYDNETVLSNFTFSSKGRTNGWSPIAVNTATVDNATLYSFSTWYAVSPTNVTISFSISSDQIRATKDSNVILQPNSIKWDLSVSNYNYTTENSTLAFVALVRSSEKVERVTRDVTHRNETEVPHNRTMRANETHLSIGDGKGRVAFTDRINCRSRNGTATNGTVLVSAPVETNEGSDLDQLENIERGDREDKNEYARKYNGGSPVDVDASRCAGSVRTKVVFTFKPADANPTLLVWDPETFVADSADANALTSTEVQAALDGTDTSVFAANPSTDSGSGSGSDSGSGSGSGSESGSGSGSGNTSGASKAAIGFVSIVAMLVGGFMNF